MSLLALAALTQGQSDEPQEEYLIENHPIIFAPNVPPPITRTRPAIVNVTLTTSVDRLPLDLQHCYDFWTFNGRVPGPFIRTRVGDILHITVTNEDQTGMMHNVDFHAVTGPGGGAEVTTVDSGFSRSAHFKLLVPGLYIYHCAVHPVEEHITNGMYGLLLVEPEGGLPRVDKEFYVMQSEFYTQEATDPNDRLAGLLELDRDAGLSETPTHVVFNGRVGALTDQPLYVKTTDKVRVFMGNIGPNLVSSFHIIGVIFDALYREGDLISPPARGVQCTTIPSGGATVVEFKCPVPGTYTLLDHSIWRSEKGAVGFIQSEGPARPDIFLSDGKESPCAKCKLHS